MAADSAYVATSVLGACYYPEALSGEAEQALRTLRVPVISTLSEVEFGSLISNKVRLKELRERRARQIIDLFVSHVDEGFYRRVALSTEHVISARALVNSMSRSIQTLDALHLAVALSEGLALITADRDFSKAGKVHKAITVLIK